MGQKHRNTSMNVKYGFEKAVSNAYFAYANSLLYVSFFTIKHTFIWCRDKIQKIYISGIFQNSI